MNTALAAHIFAPRSLHNTADREELKHMLGQRHNVVTKNKIHQEKQIALLRDNISKGWSLGDLTGRIRRYEKMVKDAERKLDDAKGFLRTARYLYDRTKQMKQKLRDAKGVHKKSRLLLKDTAQSLRSIRKLESLLPPGNGFPGGAEFQRAKSAFERKKSRMRT